MSSNKILTAKYYHRYGGVLIIFSNTEVKAVIHSDYMAGLNDKRNKVQFAKNKAQQTKNEQTGDNATIE